MNRLFDHVAVVYRLSESVNELRELVNTWTAQPGTEKLAIVPPREQRTDLGAGDVNRGELEGYARAKSGIQEEDVLDVIRGPEAPIKLRVLTLAHPRGHHTQLTFERFTGSLTA